jgi:hypothetical protein
MKATVGFPGLPLTDGFSQTTFESPGFAPAPTSIETLRHIADTISGDGAFIMQGILRKAADELESSIRREAELLARIHQLEERAAMAAELASKAVEVITPTKEEE